MKWKIMNRVNVPCLVFYFKIDFSRSGLQHEKWCLMLSRNQLIGKYMMESECTILCILKMSKLN